MHADLLKSYLLHFMWLVGLNHKNKLGLIESGKTEMRPWTEVEGHKGGWFFCATCNISVPTSAALGQVLITNYLSSW